MDKELILKAVQAVMDFNECRSGDYTHKAGIDVGMHSVWVYILDVENNFQYLLTNQEATDADIEDFIQKLDELKAV